METSNLAVKSNFIALKAEVDKLGINKLVNVTTSLNNLKTKLDNLDVDKLKSVPIDLKKISDVVKNEVVKNTEFNTKENFWCNYFNSHKLKQCRQTKFE